MVLDARVRLVVDEGLSNTLDTMSNPTQVRKLRRGAARAAGNEVAKQGRKEAPRKRGALAASIRVGVKVRGDDVTALITAGARFRTYKDGGRVTKDVYKRVVSGKVQYFAAYYAGWVQRGTRPHRISAAQGSSLRIGGKFFRSVEHPGAKPNPFMTRALQQSESRIGPAYDGYVQKSLDRLRAKGRL